MLLMAPPPSLPVAPQAECTSHQNKEDASKIHFPHNVKGKTFADFQPAANVLLQYGWYVLQKKSMFKLPPCKMCHVAYPEMCLRLQIINYISSLSVVMPSRTVSVSPKTL